jgi:hypothetical protein
MDVAVGKLLVSGVRLHEMICFIQSHQPDMFCTICAILAYCHGLFLEKNERHVGWQVLNSVAGEPSILIAKVDLIEPGVRQKGHVREA